MRTKYDLPPKPNKTTKQKVWEFKSKINDLSIEIFGNKYSFCMGESYYKARYQELINLQKSLSEKNALYKDSGIYASDEDFFRFIKGSVNCAKFQGQRKNYIYFTDIIDVVDFFYLFEEMEVTYIESKGNTLIDCYNDYFRIDLSWHSQII